MEPGGDDLQDDLVIDESIASEEDESFPFILGISQNSEDDRVASSSTADSTSLLAKKRKLKAKGKERKSKVRSCRECIFYILIVFESRSGN